MTQLAGQRVRASVERPPYIEFVYDYSSWALRPASLHHDPTNEGPDHALQVKVVHDPIGRVVVRTCAGTIASGFWKADVIADRQQSDPKTPDGDPCDSSRDCASHHYSAHVYLH